MALCSISGHLAVDGVRDGVTKWKIKCFRAFSEVDGGGSGVGFGEASAKLSSLHGGSGEAAGARPARSAPPSSSAVTVPASARAPTVGSSSAVPLPARKRSGFCFLGGHWRSLVRLRLRRLLWLVGVVHGAPVLPRELSFPGRHLCRRLRTFFVPLCCCCWLLLRLPPS